MDKKLVENFATWHVYFFAVSWDHNSFSNCTQLRCLYIWCFFTIYKLHKGCNFVDRPIFLCCCAYYHNYDASWKIKISKENWPAVD